MLQKWNDKQRSGAPKLRHQPPASRFWESVTVLHRRRTSVIAVFAATAIVVHLVLRFALHVSSEIYQIPLLGHARFRRVSSRLRTSQEPFTARIWLRSPRGNFHRHFCSSQRISRRFHRCVDALRWRGAGKLCVAQCIFGFTRFGETHAFHRASEKRFRHRGCRTG